MKYQTLHAWDLNPSEAIACQEELVQQLITQHIDLDAVQYVAGVDVSVKDGLSQAAVIIMHKETLEVIEIARAQMPTQYPYIPGLLTFREAPVVLQAFEQIQQVPDVVVFDGMGRIHPRKMGIAAHLGLWLDVPTMGVGKTHFIGEYDMPAPEKGAHTPLMYHGEQLGIVLRTRNRVKPVYVSAGHRADHNSAVKLIMQMTPKFRLPEPIRQAHHAAAL
jgi:deoxyribonuclease V